MKQSSIEHLQSALEALGPTLLLNLLSDEFISLAVNARDLLKDPKKEKDLRFIADQLLRLSQLSKR